MKGRRRVQRSYSPEEKAEALRKLAFNNGNLSRTVKETDIPTTTLRHWKDEQMREFTDPRAEGIEKFIENIWENILALNDPTFVKKLKAQLLENGSKGNLKEIAQYTSTILDIIMTLTRVQLLTRGSKGSKEKPLGELSDEEIKKLPDEELEKLIREEKVKEEKKEGT